ncbi:MAG: site-specific DNA-methyltransferase [Defluviitaleaceae bacterium]|nr:site-specific DNA-methyltransferase [Defluviitaleaceae bacterium]
MLNTIINADCLQTLKTLDNESIDLIFADPPYWMRTEGVLSRVEGTAFDGCDDDWDSFKTEAEYLEFTKTWLCECKRVLNKTGSIWVIGSMQCIYTIGGIMQELGFWFINDVVWHKKNPTPNFRGTRLNNSHETLIWATKSKDSKYTFNYKTAKELNTDTVATEDYNKGERKQLGSVWRIAVCNGSERIKDEEGNKLHPTQKPEELLYRIINISSKLGDTVLDPFGGTMTTAKVAKQCGRNYISIEQNETYCQYGEKRLQKTKTVLGNIEKAVFDIKPPKVTLSEMISLEYINKNETLYLHKGVEMAIPDTLPQAVINEIGRIAFGEIKETDIHTGAAILLGGKRDRVNGFDYWNVLRNGLLVSIKDIRKNYRKEVLGFTEYRL